MSVSSIMLDDWMTTMLHYLVEKKDRGRQRPKEYSNTHRRMINSAKKQLVRIIRKFLKDWF